VTGKTPMKRNEINERISRIIGGPYDPLGYDCGPDGGRLTMPEVIELLETALIRADDANKAGSTPAKTQDSAVKPATATHPVQPTAPVGSPAPTTTAMGRAAMKVSTILPTL